MVTRAIASATIRSVGRTTRVRPIVTRLPCGVTLTRSIIRAISLGVRRGYAYYYAHDYSNTEFL